MRKKTLNAILFLLIVISFASFVSAQRGTQLFSLVEAPSFATEKFSLAAVRQAPIVFDAAALSAENSKKLLLPLFDGKTQEAIRLKSEGLEMRAADDYTWRGKIESGNTPGDVTLTFKRGTVAGLIYSAASVYEIVPHKDGHLLVELYQSRFPECGGAVKGETTAPRAASVPQGGIDSGDRIDVLVLYTTPVKNSLGGEAQAQAFAQQSIDITNTTYINSLIRQRVRLAGAAETAIAETGNLSSELSTLRADGATAAARDNAKADLVAMLSNSSNACGIGNLIGPVTGNPANGFTVTSRTCAVGNLSFPHELGHNMGSHHNPENGGSAIYPYGYGHYVNGVYRTVMSYVDPCAAGCTRRPYFSNPNIIFSGFPTGIDGQRDNARLINNTADVIASYRYSGASITLENYNGGQILRRGLPRVIRWSADNIVGDVKIEVSRDQGNTWEPVLAATENDGQQAVTITGRSGKLSRLRVSSVNAPIVSDSSIWNLIIK